MAARKPKPSRARVLGVLSLLALAMCAAFVAAHVMETVATSRPQFQKGMTYATWTKDALGGAASEASLDRLAATGSRWVALVPTWYQRDYDSTEISPTDKTPTDASLLHAIDRAHELKLKVMLKPQLDLSEGEDVNWRGEIDFPNDPAAWRAWFASYEQFLLHYAALAQAHRVELLCVGTELTSASVWHEDLWRALIRRVRVAYKRPLTYAANWNEEYALIKFWDALDYAGLDPYFPLSDRDRPTLEELKAAWQPRLAEIAQWQRTINKPVLFTEIGYRSAKGAARAPWEETSSPVDLELQRDCYQALLETFWPQPWFSGVYWWYWGTHEKMGGTHHRGFTPQGKPAQDVVAAWYRKRR